MKVDQVKLEKLIYAVETAKDEEWDMKHVWKNGAGCALGHYIRNNPDCGLSLEPNGDSAGCRILPQETDLGEYFGIPQYIFFRSEHTKEILIGQLKEYLV